MKDKNAFISYRFWKIVRTIHEYSSKPLKNFRATISSIFKDIVFNILTEDITFYMSPLFNIQIIATETSRIILDKSNKFHTSSS